MSDTRTAPSTQRETGEKSWPELDPDGMNIGFVLDEHGELADPFQFEDHSSDWYKKLTDRHEQIVACHCAGSGMTERQYAAFNLVFKRDYACPNSEEYLKSYLLSLKAYKHVAKLVESERARNNHEGRRFVKYMDNMPGDTGRRWRSMQRYFDVAHFDIWDDTIMEAYAMAKRRLKKKAQEERRAQEKKRACDDAWEAYLNPRATPSRSRSRSRTPSRSPSPTEASKAVRLCARGAIAGVLASVRLADAARVADELARKHAEHEAKRLAEERAEEDARKARARATRAARECEGQAAFSITQPQIGKDRAVGRARTAEEQRQHELHVDPQEKAVRSQTFDGKQEQAHADRVQRNANTARKNRRNREKQRGAAQAAATHVVPVKPTLADAVAVAMAA